MAAQKTKEKAEKREGRPEAAKTVQEAWSEFRSSLRSLLPEEFWEHRRAARLEMLLAVRSLIDAAIEREEQGEAPQGKRAKKITVE
ncbi:MAG: hypothetical protein ACE5LU_06335 [Anaerolineae bacterium]